jgi:N-carbamoyl-L-amino-acid hydrolase
VVAGLECLRTIKEQGIRPAHPLEAVAFSDEEERFLGFLGSLAFTGRLVEADLDRAADETGLPLAQALAEAGLDPARIREAARPVEEIKAFVELHPEQGPVLEKAGVSMGLVDLVKGNYRFGLTLTGRQDHAGSPMAGRKDPMLPAATVIRQVNNRFRELSDDQTLMTVGLLTADPGLANVIPGSVYLTVDFRAVQKKLLAELERELERIAAREAAEAGVELRIEPLLKLDPVRFDQGILELIAQTAREAGVDHLTLPSGAGHDAQVLGTYVPSAMIFAPSQEGRSHCPQEYTSPEDIEKCANVLLGTLIRLARGYPLIRVA